MKKITEEQFVLDCINKEFELASTGVHFNTFEELKQYSALHPFWFSENQMTKKQCDEWKAYFMEHYYDWKPQSTSKSFAEKTYEWFCFNYGFSVKDES